MKDLDVYSHRGQEVMLLVGALHSLRKAREKVELINFIGDQMWIDLRLVDKKPYASNQTGEPRWKTSIAFARKDCVDLDLMEPDNDYWQATAKGLNLLPKLLKAFDSGELDIRKCWYLSSCGKRFFKPSFVSSEHDTPRPNLVYDDQQPDVSKLAEKYSHLLK